MLRRCNSGPLSFHFGLSDSLCPHSQRVHKRTLTGCDSVHSDSSEDAALTSVDCTLCHVLSPSALRWDLLHSNSLQSAAYVQYVLRVTRLCFTVDVDWTQQVELLSTVPYHCTRCSVHWPVCTVTCEHIRSRGFARMPPRSMRAVASEKPATKVSHWQHWKAGYFSK